MNKTVFPILLIGMLMIFSFTVFAHDGEEHGKEMYEEGSGGYSLDHKTGGMEHEYMEKHGDGMEHSRGYYEKKYGKHDHEKHEQREEGSGMKEEAHRMKEEMYQRKEEGSRM